MKTNRGRPGALLRRRQHTGMCVTRHFIHKNGGEIQVADISYLPQSVTSGWRYSLSPWGFSFCMKQNVRAGNLACGLGWSMTCQMRLLKCQQPSFLWEISFFLSPWHMCTPGGSQRVVGSACIPPSCCSWDWSMEAGNLRMVITVLTL